VQVDAVGDRSSFLSFQQNPTTDENAVKVTVGNQFSETTLTSVVVTVGDTSKNIAIREPIEPRETSTVTFESVSCGDTINVVALGRGVHLELSGTVNQSVSWC
jgi:hypothetical protein